jgi:hypothetical protein
MDKTLYSEFIDQFQQEIAGIEGLIINPHIILSDILMYHVNTFFSQIVLIFCF